VTCAVCGKPERGHPPCAICQVTNAHTRICAWCEKQPYNKGWVSTWEELGGEDDLAASPIAPARRLADVIDRKPRVPTPAQQAIIELALLGIVERYRYRDRRGRWRGWRTRIKALSLREIGSRTGKHWTYVRRVLARYGDG